METEMYDAVVIGARCAGSPTAMLLARKGYHVLLVDRATFPSDTFRNHFIQPPGVSRLHSWGLLDAVIGSNCPPVHTFTLDFGSVILTGSPPPIHGFRQAYGPRRIVLDKILVDAAVNAGAELRESFTVEDLLIEDGQVTGVRGRSHGGSMVSEKARLVIGADSLHSIVAETMKAPVYNEKPPLTCWYYAYWEGVPTHGTELYIRDRRVVIMFPTNDKMTCVVTVWPHDEFASYRSDIEGNYFATLAIASNVVAERVRGGRQAERFVGTADVPNLFRKPFGPGWALVGDAGYHKDPYAAQGISDAFRDAELLADAIDAGFSGRRPLVEALEEYEQLRNQSAMPEYELNAQFATLQPPSPDLQMLLKALVGNQVETDRLIGTLAGTVSIPEFFAPENVGRIVAAGSARIAG
jgi:flavin-dependent dehydrogenase